MTTAPTVAGPMALPPRVAAVLAATERAENGAVEIDGAPPGVVYLVDGCVSYVETPAAPCLGERLVASGRLSHEQWLAVREIGERGGGPGDILARYGVERHELAALTASVIMDSLLALLAGTPDGREAGRTRFRSGRRHWVDAQIRLDGAAVRDILALREPGSVRAAIRGETLVRLGSPRWRWRVVTPRQWRVLSRIDGRRRVRDLAVATGAGVYEVVDRVAELVEAGLCELDTGPGGDPPVARDVSGDADRVVPGEGAPAGARADRDPVGSVALLPRRQPGRSLPPVQRAARRDAVAPGDLAPRGEGEFSTPDPQTLRRLLGGLRRMD